MTLDAGEFIRRFLLHVLPHGFHRIRHYANKTAAFKGSQIRLPNLLPKVGNRMQDCRPSRAKGSGMRRGRRRDLNAKRRQSTWAGRIGGPDAVVEALKIRRKRASTRAGLGETSLDILPGRNVIDQAAHDAGVHLQRLLEIHRRAQWLSPPTVSRLWTALLVSSTGGIPNASTIDVNHVTIADMARRQLKAIYAALGREQYALAVAVTDDVPMRCVQSLIAGDVVYSRSNGALVLVQGEIAPVYRTALTMIAAAFSALTALGQAGHTTRYDA